MYDFQPATQNFLRAIPLAWQGTPTAVAVQDIDGQGTPDIVITDASSNCVVVFWNDSQADMQAQFTVQSIPVGSWPSALAIEDMNSDGHLDFIVTTKADNSLYIFYGDTSRTFQKMDRFDTGRLPSAVVVLDVNGDGFKDIAVANQHGHTTSDHKDISSSIMVFLNDATGKLKSIGGAQLDFENPSSLAVDFSAYTLDNMGKYIPKDKRQVLVVFNGKDPSDLFEWKDPMDQGLLSLDAMPIVRVPRGTILPRVVTDRAE